MCGEEIWLLYERGMLQRNVVWQVGEGGMATGVFKKLGTISER